MGPLNENPAPIPRPPAHLVQQVPQHPLPHARPFAPPPSRQYGETRIHIDRFMSYGLSRTAPPHFVPRRHPRYQAAPPTDINNKQQPNYRPDMQMEILPRAANFPSFQNVNNMPPNDPSSGHGQRSIDIRAKQQRQQLSNSIPDQGDVPGLGPLASLQCPNPSASTYGQPPPGGNMQILPPVQQQQQQMTSGPSCAPQLPANVLDLRLMPSVHAWCTRRDTNPSASTYGQPPPGGNMQILPPVQQQQQQQQQMTSGPSCEPPRRPVKFTHPQRVPNAAAAPPPQQPMLKPNRVTTIAKPEGLDAIALLQNREDRTESSIALREQQLQATVSEDMGLKANLELRGLRVLNLQRGVRPNIMKCTRPDTALETAADIKVYQRTKSHGLSEQENKKTQKHEEFPADVLQHGKFFTDNHRNKMARFAQINKGVMNQHANAEKEQKKDQEQIEKERMRRLMAEDEEGYRKLIGQKKDKRLALLLSETDEYISNLTQMVKQHKGEPLKKKEHDYSPLLQYKKELLMTGDYMNIDESCEASDFHFTVVEAASGKTLAGDDGPTMKYLNEWLEAHPNLSNEETIKEAEEKYEETNKKQAIGKHKHVKIRTHKDIKDEEAAELIKKAKAEDDEYRTEEYTYDSFVHTAYEKITEQPSIMVNGKLKEYQIKGLEWLVSLYNNNLNGILADEMGLGKTIQTISLVTYLMDRKNVTGPFLIIVPLSTLPNWVLEFEKWAPSVSVVSYKGSVAVRRPLQNQIRATKFNVLLTTFEYVVKDKAVLAKIQWKYMIIDEGHRMKNHRCKLTQVLNTYYFTSYRLLLTGTPLQNNLPELWALLNFLLPSIFKSCSTFEQWFNAPFATTAEKVELNEEETILIIRRLHKVLRQFLLRRLKKEVEQKLPEKIEYIIKCEMSDLQRVLYKQMQSNGVLLTDGSENDKRGKGGAKTLMNTIVQLRKLCNHPFIFQQIRDTFSTHTDRHFIGTGSELYRVSGKFELLERILPKLKATNHRVLLFCQMTQCLNIIEDYLNFRRFCYLRLDGTTKSEDRGELLRKFNAKDSEYFVFILSTRAGGLGLNLQTADTVIIFDSDWNPHQDVQAQDRAHRIGQSNEVRVLRLITVNSIEERILAAARYKLNMDEKVIQAGMFNQQSTESERQRFLQTILHGDEANSEQENKVPDDETINMMIARSDAEFEIFKTMDIERRTEDERLHPGRKRLIDESELPDWLTKYDEEKERGRNNNEGTMLGRGARQRKVVDYTESELLHAIDDVSDYSAEEEEEEEEKIKKKRRKGKKRKYDSNYESIVGHSIKQKYGQNMQKHLKKLMSQVVTAVINYTDNSGRILCGPFMTLASRKSMPDYYKIIKRPVDIKTILQRIENSKYANLDDLQSDFVQLCQNARIYNDKNSVIYRDSIEIEKVFVNTKQLMLAATSSQSASIASESVGVVSDISDGALDALQSCDDEVIATTSAAAAKKMLKLNMAAASRSSATAFTTTLLPYTPKRPTHIVTFNR